MLIFPQLDYVNIKFLNPETEKSNSFGLYHEVSRLLFFDSLTYISFRFVQTQIELKLEVLTLSYIFYC